MQFELSTNEIDAMQMTNVLRSLDPNVRLAFDEKRGRLEVLSTATAAQVLGALDSIGCVATPLLQEVHISGGSTCCGHCA